MIFFYLPALGLIHFVSASALGVMSVLSAKAISDLAGSNMAKSNMAKGGRKDRV